jgi:hypothetical protein
MGLASPWSASGWIFEPQQITHRSDVDGTLTVGALVIAACTSIERHNSVHSICIYIIDDDLSTIGM